MIAVIKVTKWCNLACDYCYMDIDPKKTAKIIDLATVTRIVEEFGNHWNYVDYSWHGGEPLRAGIKFYVDAINIQKSFYQDKPLKSYRNTIQTNALMLDKIWVEFLSSNDFGIGISYDGPSGLNSLRCTHSGQQISGKIEDKIKLIQDITGASPWVICVLSKQNVNAPEEIYGHFQQIGLDGFSILPYLGKNLELRISPLEYLQFHRTIFDKWIAEREPQFKKITPFTQLIDSLLSRRNTICSWEGRCFRDLLSIDPLGNVQLCSAFHQAEHGIGNLVSSSILSALKSEPYVGALAAQDEVLDSCSKCDVFDICRGGCREAAFHTFGNMKKKDPLCEGRRLLIFHVAHAVIDNLRKSH
uniref:radical SAM protein n=1 Tax=Aeromonas jandaei TaxID=650 RepID=UPI003B9F9A76